MSDGILWGLFAGLGWGVAATQWYLRRRWQRLAENSLSLSKQQLAMTDSALKNLGASYLFIEDKGWRDEYLRYMLAPKQPPSPPVH